MRTCTKRKKLSRNHLSLDKIKQLSKIAIFRVLLVNFTRIMSLTEVFIGKWMVELLSHTTLPYRMSFFS